MVSSGNKTRIGPPQAMLVGVLREIEALI